MSGRIVPIAVAVGGALLLAGALAAAAGVPRAEAIDETVDRWLAEMAQPSGDRGWTRLSAQAQERIYGGDRRAYHDDLNRVDWTRVVWAPTRGRLDDGRFWSGDVSLRSHPSTLPRFLFERGLAQPMCIDDLPYGIYLSMPVEWFTPPRIAGGEVRAGSADQCIDAFDTKAGPPTTPSTSSAAPGAVRDPISGSASSIGAAS